GRTRRAVYRQVRQVRQVPRVRKVRLQVARLMEEHGQGDDCRTLGAKRAGTQRQHRGTMLACERALFLCPSALWPYDECRAVWKLAHWLRSLCRERRRLREHESGGHVQPSQKLSDGRHWYHLRHDGPAALLRGTDGNAVPAVHATGITAPHARHLTPR